jgi:predicted ATP-grasp superfamily ATP-dependent carboligase
MGWQVDVFAATSSPAFLSRACHRAILSPPVTTPHTLLEALSAAIERGRYDIVVLCSEAILELLVTHGHSSRWKALPLSDPAALRTTLSKNAMIRLAESVGVAVPRSIVPQTSKDIISAANQLGLPLVIKGEKGEATRNVRIVWRAKGLSQAYDEIAAAERGYDGRPALQEFIPGSQYSIGGLFDKGRPLRWFAYRKIINYPRSGGLSAKAVSEQPPGLLKAAFAIFDALSYSGLGMTQFILDSRDGRFKFIEINPRVWGSIGFGQYVGVDLYTPYGDLAEGKSVRSDLNYRLGVKYHRFSVEMRVLFERPWHLPRFLKDCLDPRVHSDFDWRDVKPHLAPLSQLKEFLSRGAGIEAWNWSKSWSRSARKNAVQ